MERNEKGGGEKEMSNTKRICCKDCVFFIRTEDGPHGGIKGKCRIRKPNEVRAGNMTRCKMFKKEEKKKGK